ncbi:MAG: FKBP-type peptidyl-prolyl cis-trans isomerase [Neolewinella sp.]|mgnify:CR=1 FL=1|jgi:FKBP-type peptidyl-prolyl cis-trans isomerase
MLRSLQNHQVLTATPTPLYLYRMKKRSKKLTAQTKARAGERIEFAKEIRRQYLAGDLEPARTNAGLGFVIHEQGDGKPAKRNKIVEVHYIGLLAKDGSLFDDSFHGGRAIKFRLGQGEVIGGWDIGIGLLSEGDRATFFVPPALGYGSEGVEGIPARSELIFYVELVCIS